MSIVVEVRTCGGELLGRCDAKCYDAHPGTRCVCICRGANHAQGEAVALYQADELAASWEGVASTVTDPRTAQRVLWDPRTIRP